MKLYVVNVGVNSADAKSRKMKSPIFADGRFEFIPIKESYKDSQYASYIYKDLKCFNNTDKYLSDYLPKQLSPYKAHNDPEFITMTYGDIFSSRASNLKNIESGDIVVFLARLYNYCKSQFIGENDFYFIGYFTVEKILYSNEMDTNISLNSEKYKNISNNAHFQKFINGDNSDFILIKGNSNLSFRFKRAVNITPSIVELLYNGRYNDSEDCFYSNRTGNIIVNKTNGKPRKYMFFHSTTRTIQYYLDSESDSEYRSMTKLLDLFSDYM